MSKLMYAMLAGRCFLPDLPNPLTKLGPRLSCQGDVVRAAAGWLVV
ncbi:MAG: hypothetical protein HGJ97_08285 [Desulfosporosinus sp.]|nr:hypothetical protein [Desulfosporosinus sp.]